VGLVTGGNLKYCGLNLGKIALGKIPPQASRYTAPCGQKRLPVGMNVGVPPRRAICRHLTLLAVLLAPILRKLLANALRISMLRPEIQARTASGPAARYSRNTP